MIKQKDALIMAYLRNNAREKITTMSKKTDIPATTIYDMVRKNNKQFVTKHVALLDFPKLGFNTRAHISLKVAKDGRAELAQHLLEHPNVNSLYSIDFGSDFLAEVVFRNTGDLKNFIEDIEKRFGITQSNIYNIVSELKKEGFYTKPEHFDMV